VFGCIIGQRTNATLSFLADLENLVEFQTLNEERGCGILLNEVDFIILDESEDELIQ
jgi:hypothetical protein